MQPADQFAVGKTRRQRVDAARQAWTNQLIDLSHRNPLLYFRELKTGTLLCRPSDPRVFDSLLAGHPVDILRVAGAAGDPEARSSVLASARAIRRKALENQEERGLHTCHLVIGLASWRVTGPDADRPPRAPVLLIPVTLEAPGTDWEHTLIRCHGDVTWNLVLLQALRRAFGVSLDSSLPETGEGPRWATLVDAVAHLQQCMTAVPDFRVHYDGATFLGNFAFQKLAMVRDLDDWGARMAEHDVVAALAGDSEARAAVLAQREMADTEAPLDDLPPDDEFHVLDADASQIRVIRAVVRGQTGVIQGPPGTGKSQTIANAIAELAARGRRVLFVAEKRAALDVVRQRLKEVGLGHLVLDLHGADVSRQTVMRQIAAGLDHLRDALPVDATAVHRDFVQRRRALVEHVRRLHRPVPPAQLSPYALMGQLLRLPAPENVGHRWRGPALERLTPEVLESLAAQFAALGTFADLLAGRDPSPWANARFVDGEHVQAALDLVHTLAWTDWPALDRLFDQVHATTGLPLPRDLAAAETTVALLHQAETVSTVWAPSVFGPEWTAAAAAFARAGDRVAWWARWIDPAIRRAERRLRAHLRVPLALSPLARAVREAADLQARWAAYAGADRVPVAFPKVTRLAAAWAQTRTNLEALRQLLRVPDADTRSWAAWRAWVQSLAADSTTPWRLPRLYSLLRDIDAAQGGPLLQELFALNVPPAEWENVCRWVWYRSCLDACFASEPLLGGFDGREHDRIVREFARLDRERVAKARERVRRAHAEQVIATLNRYPDEAHLVRGEALKQRRQRPLRRLFEAAPHVLATLFPCWMASPLSISQLLPAATLFDVVLFDEASQVLPEDAVPALLRGRQAVVAGDRHQLPPTMFFAAENEEVDAPEAVSGFESLLDLLAGFLTPWSLEWHYRSRDERLIAFSNHHIYHDRLVTFPGPGGDPVLAFHPVPQVVGQDGDPESNSTEVRAVVDLVLEEARRRPSASLGVITMGIRHAQRIQAALDARLRGHPELAPFFAEDRPERFFIKNLERVQGDERDTIILSIGYGKDRTGQLPHRFGPLNQAGGERRLNVAVTRARERMVVVAAFDHRDIDPGRSASRGIALLRAFLEYAATGDRVLEPEGIRKVPLNAFEADVYDALTARGLRLLPQYGVSRYRLDFAVQHPRQPGRMVLALECDGARYHSAPAARDRDRLRQQQLEALGWRFYRIWSVDWFLRREHEIALVLAAYEYAVRAAADPPPRPQPPPPPAGAAHAPATSGRGTRPSLPVVRSIEDYGPDTLDRLIAWILSDGILRDDEQLVREVIRELGFRRRGSRIEAAVRAAIARCRSRDRSSFPS
ncbi:MAG: AAA domain-containing protein [Thermaerobacter sp.]|nr:AAA domain-containing protein [Thermaerobacter sp.]